VDSGDFPERNLSPGFDPKGTRNLWREIYAAFLNSQLETARVLLNLTKH